MRYWIIPLLLLLFLSYCSKNSSVGPVTPDSADSIKQFVLDSLELYDTLHGLDTARNRSYFQQGPLESTGNIWDLAIQGNALFALELDSQKYFLRRPGKFFLDKEGYVVREFNGPRLLGWPLDSVFIDSTVLRAIPIRIPFQQTISPPKATTLVRLMGNLDSDNEGKGTVLCTQPFYHRVDEFNSCVFSNTYNNSIGINGMIGGAQISPAQMATDLSATSSVRLTDLHNASGYSLLISSGDVISVSASIMGSGGSLETMTAYFGVIDDPSLAGRISGSLFEYQVATLGQLLLGIQEFLGGKVWNSGAGSNVSGVAIGITPDGKIRIENGVSSTQSILDLTVSSDRPVSRTYICSAFAFDSEILKSGESETPDRLLRPALAADHLYNPFYYDVLGAPVPGTSAVPAIFTANGQALDLENGDKVNITAMVGDRPKNSNLLQMNQGTNLNTSTAMQDLLDAIRSTLELPQFDGATNSRLSVDINPGRTADDNIPEGAIVIRGQPEAAFAISNLSIVANNSNMLTEAPTDFNTNAVVTQLQAARNSGYISSEIEIYDALGTPHMFVISFLHSGITNPATWLWEVNGRNGVTITGGGKGRVTFSQNGSPSAFIFNDTGVTQVSLNPNNGAPVLIIRLDWGASGMFTGLTQFCASSTAACVAQDGYPSGQAEEFFFDEQGTIGVHFTNGVDKPLWKIAFAEFSCRIGLKAVGYNYFISTDLSGDPVFGQMGGAIRGSLAIGALESDPVIY